jgi:ABC-type branched-subunit amino acid transport system substrate-binding protein
LLCAALGLLLLASCSGATVDGGDTYGQGPRDPNLPPVPPLPTLQDGQLPSEGTLPAYPNDGTIRVAILLPLSGPRASLGKAMQNAAELAMFEIAGDKFTLMPFDTQGTPAGASAAAEKAVTEGVRLILGPLLASSVEAVAPVARMASVQVVAFSNSQRVAGEGVFIMGFVPEQQVTAIVDFAGSRGLARFAVLAPQDEFGQTVVQSTQDAARQRGGALVRTQSYDPAAADFSKDVKLLADYDQRRKALMQQRAQLKRQPGEVSRRALKRLEKRDTIGDVDFDAVLIPETGQRLRALASLLSYYDVDPPAVRMLGLRNWDEIPKPESEPSLIGAWFAAPAPAEWAGFATRFKSAFGRAPARLSSLAYDATALAAVLAQGEGGPDFSFEALTNPNGFLGVDGCPRDSGSPPRRRGDDRRAAGIVPAIHQLTVRGVFTPAAGQ